MGNTLTRPSNPKHRASASSQDDANAEDSPKRSGSSTLTDMHTKYPKHGVMHCNNFALPDRDTITSQTLPTAVELRSDRLKFPLLLAKYKEMNKGTPWAEGSEPPTPGRSQRVTRPPTVFPGMLVDRRPV